MRRHAIPPPKCTLTRSSVLTTFAPQPSAALLVIISQCIHVLLYVTYFDFILISEDPNNSGILVNAAEFTSKYAKTGTAYTINIGGTDYFAKNTVSVAALPADFVLPTCVAATKNPTANPTKPATKSPTAAAAGASTSAPLPVLTAALATLAATLFW